MNPALPAPIWSQIEDGVRHLVASGALTPGAPVPSVRDLARAERINPNTVAKAYQRLADAGVLETRRGEGTFVAERPPAMKTAERTRALRDGAMRYASLAVNLGASRGEAAEVLSAEWPDGDDKGRSKVTTLPAAEVAAAPRAAVETVVDVRGLTVRYGRRLILDGVSLQVPRGAVYALLGRNGVGKSSLMRCLLGQQRADGGELRLFGLDCWRERQALMERVGIVPEEPDAPPELTVRQLTRFCGQLNVRWDEAAVLHRLARFEVPLDTRFHRLSKGQKGAVMLALSLGHGPELLLLDDPTLGLDVVARRTVFGELIGELADRGTTVLLTTHDLAGVEGVADRIGILHGSRLVLEGELEAVKAERGLSLEEIFASVAGERHGEATEVAR